MDGNRWRWKGKCWRVRGKRKVGDKGWISATVEGWWIERDANVGWAEGLKMALDPPMAGAEDGLKEICWRSRAGLAPSAEDGSPPQMVGWSFKTPLSFLLWLPTKIENPNQKILLLSFVSVSLSKEEKLSFPLQKQRIPFPLMRFR